jgi:hypothetical protein
MRRVNPVLLALAAASFLIIMLTIWWTRGAEALIAVPVGAFLGLAIGLVLRRLERRFGIRDR